MSMMDSSGFSYDKSAKSRMQCVWHPSEPGNWHYTEHHRQALHSSLTALPVDLIHVTESYILDPIETTKRVIDYDIYYQYARPPQRVSLPQHVLTDIHKFPLKIAVFGAEKVGKTSLCHRVATDTFAADHHVNGMYDDRMMDDEFHTEVVCNGRPLRLQLIDSRSYALESWNVCRHFEIRQMDALWLCFDVTEADSFYAVVDKLRHIVRICEDEPKCIVLVACRKDLECERLEEYEKVIRCVQQFGDVPYIETSVKTGENVQCLVSMTVNEWCMQTQRNIR